MAGYLSYDGLYGTGRVHWSGVQDEEGHRDYTLISRVMALPDDGPTTVMDTSDPDDLPDTGSYWSFGNDSDPDALCLPYRKVTPHADTVNIVFQETPIDVTPQPQARRYWDVEQKFTTRPFGDTCKDETNTNPLTAPMKISGSFVNRTEEAERDLQGNLIISSSYELFRGRSVEFDKTHPTVTIEMNLGFMALGIYAQFVNYVNGFPMWGLPARTIKLSTMSWERLAYGRCFYYYKWRLEFDIDYQTWDRQILDEGTKALGYWHPETKVWIDSGSLSDPSSFTRYKDKDGELSHVVLNGLGKPLTDGNNPIYRNTQFYPETTFTLIGIPDPLPA